MLSTPLLLKNMERVNFQYSMRNIPIPTNKEYTKRLIEKTEDVLRRMRWKALFFLHPETKSNDKETY